MIWDTFQIERLHMISIIMISLMVAFGAGVVAFTYKLISGYIKFVNAENKMNTL